MKFIKVITLTLIGFSSQALSTTASASAPIDQFDDEQSQVGRFLRGGSSCYGISSPNSCPCPSRMQMIGNPCPSLPGRRSRSNERTICCAGGVSWVQCSAYGCPGSQNFATSTTTLSALPTFVEVEQDSEDYGGKGDGGYGSAGNTALNGFRFK